MREDNTYYDEMDGLNLPGSLRANPFAVPENYFAELAEQVQCRVKLEEDQHLKAEAWEVPQSYFDDLSAHILVQARLYADQDQEDFTVPQGYFEQLSSRIQTAVFEEQLRHEVTESGFGIPKGYEVELSAAIIAKTTGAKKESGAIRKMPSRGWIRYVAAACVLFALSLTGYYTYTLNRTAKLITPTTHLASLSDDEIINYLSASNDSEDMLYMMEYMYPADESDGICSQVQEDDIEDYLNYAL